MITCATQNQHKHVINRTYGVVTVQQQQQQTAVTSCINAEPSAAIADVASVYYWQYNSAAGGALYIRTYADNVHTVVHTSDTHLTDWQP